MIIQGLLYWFADFYEKDKPSIGVSCLHYQMDRM